ncbi:hypothetical protein ILUMI_20582 [Ignelater luminosus]|uniref:Uncharacterized protein n=1 Tax=Ignelater luminosus TaxID=2038154 RepID=A0A8K0G4Q8_IGNLU|nr:hypothetical protein ILUMI_20582 [Ignelater luminosus]
MTENRENRSKPLNPPSRRLARASSAIISSENTDELASGSTDTDTVSNGNSSIQSIVDLEDTQSIQSIIDLDDIHPQNYYPPKATVGAPYVITSYSTSPRETVRKLLDSTEEGLIIKNSYGSSKQFLRSNLCTLIIKDELKYSDDKRICTERFKQLAQKINNIFIHEDPSIYYLPYTRGVNGKVVAARGKFKFVNISGEDEDSLKWLKNNSQPFEDVSQHWRKTTKLHVNTEYKFTKLYEESGLLLSSKTIQIGEKMKPSRLNNDVVLKPVPACIKMISLIDLFTNLLTSGELLNDMKTQYSELLKETNVVSNFVQCNLWKSKVFNYDDKTVFPLILFFDDYEVGNALGSRAGKNKLGAVYVSLPSLPPHITSKLNNIFLFALFYSNDHKLFGNNIFSKLIEELQYLQDNGILVLNETVYFKVGLISGDNLGVHSILGSTETGIKENCIWHNLSGFHVVDNFTVDIMHDLFEGVCNYDISGLLRAIIYSLKLFSIDTLNSRIQMFNYTEIESSNRPPIITVDRLKSDGLGIWELWIKLREIIDLVTAVDIYCKDFIRLKTLVEEHHILYIKYIGNLKPKHHHLVHYPTILQMSGPLRHLWSMRAEQKHRESNLTANVSCSYKNMLQTLIFKTQLRIGHLLNSKERKCNDNFAPVCNLSTEMCIQYFPNCHRDNLFSTT